MLSSTALTAATVSWVAVPVAVLCSVGAVCAAPTLASVVNALQFDWAPTARQAADHAVLKQIAASFRANPDWQKRVLEVQRKIAEQRRQHHADAAERRKWDRLYRDIVDDIQHYRFLDYIRQ